MANETALDLHVPVLDFVAARAALLALKVNRTTGRTEEDAVTRAVAQWANLVDDFVIAAQALVRQVYVGAGSPEGVVEAPVGSLYQRTNGGVGTTLYAKESGTGNTGWSALTTAGASIVESGTGSPEGALVAPVGSIYLRTDGAAGSVLYVKETGAGNTGWGALIATATLALVRSGSGSPEGAVTAGVGSIYLRTGGGVATTVYTKESGSGNTGWIALAGSTVRTGTGSPEAAVTAPVGTLYLRSDGAANTALYVKESGSGNTGWVDALTFNGAAPVLLLGDASGAPIMRIRKADASEGVLEFQNNQAGTPQRRGDVALTTAEDMVIRVYNSSGTIVATWTFFSDGDTQIPGSFLFGSGSGSIRLRSHASSSPVAVFSAQPTSPLWQRDSGVRWWKKQATDTTGWVPEHKNAPQVQTTNATITTHSSFTMQDNSALQIRVRATAKTAATAACKAFDIVALFRRHATGGATIVGTPVDATGGTLADASLATAVVTIDASGNDVRVRVTGIAATTINWDVVIDFGEARDTV